MAVSASKKKKSDVSKSRNQKQSFWQIYDLFVSECGRLNDWTEATYEKFAVANDKFR